MRKDRAKVMAGLSAVLVTAAGCVLSAYAATGSVTYTYDELGRLRIGTFSDGKKVDYQYDPAGNRTTSTSGTPPQLQIGNAASVNEGSTLSFPVTRTGSSTQNITVYCVTQNGTAVAGQPAPLDDFVSTNQQLVFYPSDPSPTTKNCTVQTKTDSYYEGTQSLTATLQNSVGAIIIPGNGTGSIIDINSGPQFSIASAANTEGSAISLTITKTGLTEMSHAVTYATANGTAMVADADYTAVGPAAVSFGSTQTSAIVQVATTQDAKYETAETLTVSLSSPTNGATLGASSSATGTINNDDSPPSITINDPAAKNEGQVITFRISNVGNTNTALTHSISWATANSTATSGSDYTAASGTVSFAAGETYKDITVQTLTDGVYEGSNETFLVNLTTNGSSNGAVISDAQGIGTIADIDNPTPSVPTLSGSTGLGKNYSISWTAATGPVSYYVLEESLFFSAWSPFPNIPHPTLSKTFTNMPSGEYQYRVKACSATGICSAYSNIKNKTVCNPTCQ